MNRNARIAVAGPEATVERYARKRIADSGGEMEKHVSPQKRGVRDNLVMWPGGIIDFIEFKAPGEPVEGRQARDHARCRKLGQRIAVIRFKEEVEVYCYMRKYKNRFVIGLDK